jgi:flavin-dependent dehydrogenase
MAMDIGDVDVLVAGAGPAGATVARLLARRGKRVVLVDPATRHIDRLEVIPPSGWPVLEALDLTQLLDETALARPCLGIRRRWGAAPAAIDDFQTHRGGRGFVLDRIAFDKALRAAAADAGVTSITGRVAATRRDDGQTTVMVETPSGRQTIHVALVVDATGRPSAVARRMGARRLASEPLIAERRNVDRTVTTRNEPAWLDVKGRLRCWSYQVSGPDGRRERWIVYPPSGRRHRRSTLRADASSAILSQGAGDGWIAVGDAAIAFDPVTSQGLTSALATSVVAAGAILSPRGLDDESSRIYSDAIAATFAHSEVGRAAVYDALA